MDIYCPICKTKINEIDDPYDLEGYRIDCRHCGLSAYVEDVSINK